MKLRIEFKLQGYARHDDAAGVYVAHCPALDLYSQGNTIEESKAAIESAVHFFVSHCYDKGILGKLLNERGFQPLPSTGASDGQDDGEYIGIRETDETFDFDVPLELIAMTGAGGREHRAWQS